MATMSRAAPDSRIFNLLANANSQMQPVKHLFIIGADALDAVSDAEVKATVEALHTLGLYNLPYDRVSVRVPMDRVTIVDRVYMEKYRNDDTRWKLDKDGIARTNFGPNHWAQVDNLNLRGEPIHGRFVHETSGDGWKPYNIQDDAVFARATTGIANLLITLLATKNALKHTTRNKLAALGIGGRKCPSKRYEYTTTISVPSDLEDDHQVKPGGPKAAHLRRGHIRRQHYGPAFQYVKQIWIAPIFVNADKDFISTRKAYNVLGGAHK